MKVAWEESDSEEGDYSSEYYTEEESEDEDENEGEEANEKQEVSHEESKVELQMDEVLVSWISYNRTPVDENANADNTNTNSSISTLADSPKKLFSSETIEKEGNLTVIDRSLLHGDIVALKENQQQTGTVIDVSLSLDIAVFDNKNQVLELIQVPNVNSREVKALPASEYEQGDTYVVHNKLFWVGIVEDFTKDVTIQFPDGCVCIIKGLFILSSIVIKMV